MSSQANKKEENSEQPLLNTMKLAVAIALKQDGYNKIEFDKPVEFGELKARVHVVGQDALGMMTAVYCINRKDQLDPVEIFDMARTTHNALGDECEVVIAIPVYLLSAAEEVIGITRKTFLLDEYGRVWVYYEEHPVHVSRPRLPKANEKNDDPENQTIQTITTYMQAHSYIV